MANKQNVNINIGRLNGSLPGAGGEVVAFDGSTFTADTYAKILKAYHDGKTVALTMQHPQYSTYTCYYWLMGVATQSLYFVTIKYWANMELEELVINQSGGYTTATKKPADVVGSTRGFYYADTYSNLPSDNVPEGSLGIAQQTVWNTQDYNTAVDSLTNTNPTGEVYTKAFISRQGFFDLITALEQQSLGLYDNYICIAGDSSMAEGNPWIAIKFTEIDADSYTAELKVSVNGVHTETVTINRSDAGTDYYELSYDWSGTIPAAVDGNGNNELYNRINFYTSCVYFKGFYSVEATVHRWYVYRDYQWNVVANDICDLDDLTYNLRTLQSDYDSLDSRVRALETPSNP